MGRTVLAVAMKSAPQGRWVGAGIRAGSIRPRTLGDQAMRCGPVEAGHVQTPAAARRNTPATTRRVGAGAGGSMRTGGLPPLLTNGGPPGITSFLAGAGAIGDRSTGPRPAPGGP